MIIETEGGTSFNNFIIFEKQPQFTLDLNSAFSGSQIEQEFDKDPFLDALAFFGDRFNLEWCLNYTTTPPTIKIRDAGQLGNDLSQSVIFERGENLITLQIETSGQALSTLISFDGKGQAFSQTLAQAVDFDAWEKYGIIEEIISDGRVSENALAQGKAESYLQTVKDGVQSMNARLLETFKTFGKWGLGDYVWVRDDFQNVNRPARVIKINYTENSPEIEVTFQKLPYSMAKKVGRHGADIRKIFSGGKGDNTDQTFTIERSKLLIDDYNTDWVYVDGAGAGAGPPITTWQSISGGAGLGAFQGTLHYNNLTDSFTQITFFGSGVRIYITRDTNIAIHRIQITDSLTPVDTSINGNNGTRQDKYLLYKIPDGVWAVLQSEQHILTISRNEAADLNKFINIDAIYLRGWFKQFFIELRAISKAVASWKISNQSVLIQIFIDGVDVTENVGGPAAGFTLDQENVNLIQFLSQPGLHSIEFVNNSWDSVPGDPDVTELTLEATINVSGLI